MPLFLTFVHSLRTLNTNLCYPFEICTHADVNLPKSFGGYCITPFFGSIWHVQSEDKSSKEKREKGSHRASKLPLCGRQQRHGTPSAKFDCLSCGKIVFLWDEHCCVDSFMYYHWVKRHHFELAAIFDCLLTYCNQLECSVIKCYSSGIESSSNLEVTLYGTIKVLFLDFVWTVC